MPTPVLRGVGRCEEIARLIPELARQKTGSCGSPLTRPSRVVERRLDIVPARFVDDGRVLAGPRSIFVSDLSDIDGIAQKVLDLAIAEGGPATVLSEELG